MIDNTALTSKSSTLLAVSNPHQVRQRGEVTSGLVGESVNHSFLTLLFE